MNPRPLMLRLTALLFVTLLSPPASAMDVCGEHRAALDRREASRDVSMTKDTPEATQAAVQAHFDLRDATRALHAVIDLRLSDRTRDVAHIVEPFREINEGLTLAYARTALFISWAATEEREAQQAVFDAMKQTERAYHLLLRLACPPPA